MSTSFELRCQSTHLGAVAIRRDGVGVDVVRIGAAEAGVVGQAAEDVDLDKGGLSVFCPDELKVGVDVEFLFGRGLGCELREGGRMGDVPGSRARRGRRVWESAWREMGVRPVGLLAIVIRDVLCIPQSGGWQEL
jgi:hypothetical protein